MGPARPQMREVDLVEVDEVDVAPVPGHRGDARPGDTADAGRAGEVGDQVGGTGDDGEEGGRPHPRRPGRRTTRRWGTAVVLSVALVAGGGAVASERRESARLAAVADLPGVLDPIDAPLVEVWRSDHRLWSPVSDVAGLLVGVSDVWEGSRDVVVVGLDAATGSERWSTTVVRAATSPIGGVRCVVPDAPAGGAEADRVVVCLTIDELGPAPQDMSMLEPRRSRLLVLAATTGELLSERTVDPTTSVAALGPDLVLKEVTDDGSIAVTRTGPRGRDVRWTFAGPPSAVRPDYSFVRTDEDLVIVPGESGWVLDAEGDVVHAWEADRPAAAGWADVMRGRVLVQPMRDVIGETRIADLRSGRSFTTDGYALRPTVDDGSTGDLVLVQSARDEGLLAQDVASGRTRWAVDGDDEGGVLVLDGRVLRAETHQLSAVDASTGELLWETPSVHSRQYGLHSDGRVVVRTERDPELGTVLVGRGLDDGRVRWTSDVGDDLDHLVEVEGRLYGITEDGTVAFGEGSGGGERSGGPAA